MEVDYIFLRRIFSSEKSARAKILTEWKTALTTKVKKKENLKWVSKQYHFFLKIHTYLISWESANVIYFLNKLWVDLHQ